MARGSPGGILLIGVGVVLLNLGWTGRFSAVWDAITGGSGGTDNGGTPNGSGSGSNSSNVPPALNCGKDYEITVNGDTKCYSPSVVSSPENGKCRSGYDPGTRDDGSAVCVQSGGGTLPGNDKPGTRCIERRSIPTNQIGIHVSDWKDCCMKEILMYNPNAGREPYLCITRESDIDHAKAQGYSISFRGTAGEAYANIVQLPTGFMARRYAPNGRL